MKLIIYRVLSAWFILIGLYPIFVKIDQYNTIVAFSLIFIFYCILTEQADKAIGRDFFNEK